MKWIVSALVCLTINAQAQQMIDAELKTPYNRASCQTIGMDIMGELGLSTHSFATQNSGGNEISITMVNSLSVCRLSDNNGVKSFAWMAADPYAGFQVQYYSDATHSVQERPVWIDSAKSYNRVEMIALDPETGKSWRSRMSSRGNGSFGTTLKVDKASILSAQDLANIRNGQTVRKVLELYHVINTTTVIDGEEMGFGDDGLSGRNVILYFSL